MSGIYNTDGSINVNVVDGETFVGFYSADGAMNVVDASQDGGKGIYHPCGAIRVTLDDDARTRYAPDGSMYVSTAGTGAGLFVTGDFEGGDEEPEPIHPTELEGLTALYDISDLSTLFVERTGASATTPASVDGVVGTVLDLSGNGNHAVAPSDEARPILRRNGSIYYLEWDEVDDGLIIGTLNLASSLRWTVATAYTPSGTDWVLIHSHNNNEPWAGTGQDGSSSTVLVPSSGISQNALYFDNVLSEETTRGGQYTLSQAANRAILDFTVSADFSSVKIGMYTPGGFFFLGPMHAFVIIEGELEAGVRTQLDAWLASRAPS